MRKFQTIAGDGTSGLIHSNTTVTNMGLEKVPELKLLGDIVCSPPRRLKNSTSESTQHLILSPKVHIFAKEHLEKVLTKEEKSSADKQGTRKHS